MRGDQRGSGDIPRPRTNGTNGSHPPGLRTRSLAIDLEHAGSDADAEPVDLVAVQADDELISAIAAGTTVSTGPSVGYGSDDRIMAVLAAWRADADAEPVPELVDVDTALAVIASTRPRPGRIRLLAPVAAAAAFVVLAAGGLSVGSYTAEPEDVLWPVAKVLYSERTASVEAADRVGTRIVKAKQAIAEGKPEVAEQELRAATADLAVIRPEEGRTELAVVQDFLAAKAQETPPGVPTDPGGPLAADRTRPVPTGAGIDEPLPAPGTATKTPSVPAPSSPTGVGDESTGSTPAGPPHDPRGAPVRPAPAERPDGPEISTVPTVDPDPQDEPDTDDPEGPTSSPETPDSSVPVEEDPSRASTSPGRSLGDPLDETSGVAATVGDAAVDDTDPSAPPS